MSPSPPCGIGQVARRTTAMKPIVIAAAAVLALPALVRAQGAPPAPAAHAQAPAAEPAAAAIGAIAGDAGKGAAIGAVGGGVGGRAGQKQANAAAQQKAQDEAKQAQANTKTEFNKAFGACLEGKGYTVK